MKIGITNNGNRANHCGSRQLAALAAAQSPGKCTLRLVVTPRELAKISASLAIFVTKNHSATNLCIYGLYSIYTSYNSLLWVIPAPSNCP